MKIAAARVSGSRFAASARRRSMPASAAACLIGQFAPTRASGGCRRRAGCDRTVRQRPRQCRLSAPRRRRLHAPGARDGAIERALHADADQHDVEFTVNGTVLSRAAIEWPDAAERFPAPRIAARRHPCRLRTRRLRRLHGAARWPAGPLLPDARGAGQWPRAHDRRGARAAAAICIRSRRPCTSITACNAAIARRAS